MDRISILEVWVEVTVGAKAQGQASPGCVQDGENMKFNCNEGFTWWRDGEVERRLEPWCGEP